MITLCNFSEQHLLNDNDDTRYGAFIGFMCMEARSLEIHKTKSHQIDKALFLEDCSTVDLTMGLDTRLINSVEVSMAALAMKENSGRHREVENKIMQWLEHIAPADNVLLDVSSMPRDVIASVFQALEWWCKPRGEVRVTIGYCLAKYTPPPESTPHNKAVKYVHPRFAGGQMNTGLPVAAITGLGYEKGKALGAVEYLQSDDWWAFIPESSEEKYLNEVKQHNIEFLRGCGSDRVLTYQVGSPLMTLFTIESLVAGMKGKYKPVLLPFGPKIFFACALLVAMIRSECSVFYVTGEDSEQSSDRVATKDIMGLSFTMRGKLVSA